MAEKKGGIRGAIRFIIGMFLAVLAIRNLIRAVKHVYRSIRGVSGR